jgi:ADP-heptose:LPS heptosyltransferase
VETLDVPWLARGDARETVAGLARRAREWRSRRYDLALNLEGDIRSNLMLGASRAPVRVGFGMAGGGDALTDVATFDPRRHTEDNAREIVRLAARVTGAALVEPAPVWPRLTLSPEARREAAALIGGAGAAGSLVGLHTSGGREIKQWHPERFAAAVSGIARKTGARVVLTGTMEDRPLVAAARAAIDPGIDVLDLTGPLSLLTLAAILERLDLYVTGDTGPMHLAAAVGTPVVAVFGLSSPLRYAPLAPFHRIVRIDLPCSPCNRVRLPPAWCRGHVPDCLEGITADMVQRAGLELLTQVRTGSARHQETGRRS